VQFRRTTVSILAALLCPVAGAIAAPDFSKPTTFAQFTPTTGDTGQIYTDVSGGPATLTSIPGGVPIVFEFLNLPDLPADLQGPQNAHLFFNAVAGVPLDSAAVQSVGNFLTQTMSNLTPPDSTNFSIVRDAPAGEGAGNATHLLDVSFAGMLVGSTGGTSLSWVGIPHATVGALYRSDFLNVESPQVIGGMMNLAFSGLQAGLSVDTATGNFNSFTVSGLGSFDLTTADGNAPSNVPEPATLSLLAFGALVLLRRPTDK
jgi:hypothetical protein